MTRVPDKQQPGLQPHKLTVSDREFLPAALEILLTPPSPISQFMLLSICGLFFCALAWSYFGWIDIYAIAPGRIQPAGHSKILQPLDAGKVVAVRVKNGDHVNAGDVLLELDFDGAGRGPRGAEPGSGGCSCRDRQAPGRNRGGKWRVAGRTATSRRPGRRAAVTAASGAIGARRGSHPAEIEFGEFCGTACRKAGEQGSAGFDDCLPAKVHRVGEGTRVDARKAR